MEIVYFDTLHSTHTWAIEQIEKAHISSEIACVAHQQTDGIGSRGNSWIGCEGNLFASIIKPKSMLPKDLPLSSISIYFAYLLQESLMERGSQVWLKWPNDLYVKNLKIGGFLSLIKGDFVVVSFGLNSFNAPEGFGVLDIRIDNRAIMDSIVKLVEKKYSWKQVFSKYKLQFELSKDFFAHKDEKKISLKNAILNDDGSLLLDNERIYSLR